MSDIKKLIQKPFPGVEVVMYDLDLTAFGGPTIYFCNFTLEDGSACVWKGHTYQPVAMEVKGYGKRGDGRMARPKMTIGNGRVSSADAAYSLSALSSLWGDFVDGKVRRWRTYRQFLDDAGTADPNTYFPVETYIVNQKLSENAIVLEWELSTKLDQEGTQLPRGIMTSKYCPWTYRVWDDVANEFVYDKVICPYAGEDMFDENGDPTEDPTEDKCSKKVDTGCRKRFGTNAPLPFGGFPAMPRLTRRS